MARIFKFKGKTEEELKQLPLHEVVELLKSRERRSLKRGYTVQQKKLLAKIHDRIANNPNNTKPIKTQVRDLIITPDIFGARLSVYNGKEYVGVEVDVEKVGHRIGEFTKTRKDVSHKAPGIGATKGSKSASVK